MDLMNPVIEEVLNRYYRQGDELGYLVVCSSPLRLPPEITNRLPFVTWLDHNLGEVFPSCKWTLDLGEVRNGEFAVHYSSVLMVSKIAPVYYVHHEFQVQNRDTEAMSPTLDGFDTQPYTKKQFTVDSVIQQAFDKMGYQKLSIQQMNEVVTWLEFKEEMALFGEQVTLEYALFHDIFDRCPE